jgi:DUF4097 and DUF4098 domain-containing protein YvlB
MYRFMQLVRTALLAAAGAAALSAAGLTIEEFSHTYAFSPRGRISLENPNGDVRITTWDRDEVRVEAVKRASSTGQLEGARIQVDAAGDVLSIRTRYAGSNPEEPASVEYRITVPKRALLEDIRLVNGELSMTGVAGGVKASSINGSIHARQMEGEATLSTVNGQVEAAFDQVNPAKAISLTSVNGPIALALPAGARAQVSARNLSGGIRTDFGRPLRIAPSGGQHLRTNIKGGGSTRIHLHNVNGGISITGVRHKVPVG